MICKLCVFIKLYFFLFIFNATAPTEIYTLSLHDALPILPVSQRKSAYVQSRLADQRLWYAAKAEYNSRRAKMLFSLVIGCHALALVAAIANVRWPEGRFNLTGVFAALASALIAWTQLKKYEEQANVYGLTAQELRSIEEQGRHADTEDAFARFVEEAEGAITRENAIWLAKREQ